MKSDTFKHKRCISKIKKSTFQPYDAYKHSQFYENNTAFFNLHPEITFELNDGELFICSTIIDSKNYSILTSQKLITSENERIKIGTIANSEIISYGDFKGSNPKDLTIGKINLEDGEIFEYFIETGKASMIMIQGVKTLVQISKKTKIQEEL